MSELMVNIDDDEFLKKPEEERSLLIFKAVSAQQVTINRIDEEGCKAMKRMQKNGRRKIALSVSGVGVAAAGLFELIKSFLGR